MMNIYFLDEDPVLSAKGHCDRDLHRMIAIGSKILQEAHKVCDTHRTVASFSHPCSRWARATASNYTWLVTNLIALCDEYKTAFGIRHPTMTRLMDDLHRPPTKLLNSRDVKLTSFPQHMPTEFVLPTNPILAHRLHYVVINAHSLRYTNRPRPVWLGIILQEK